MRLKNLELQGYKSFASKSEFVFPTGITAIVGPNGSGKSNIADAIRWVLGEQSFSALRAKRTEELIFAGSEGRPRAGMASAALTLDNSDNWLPIEFSEVTINRQATRDGQNKYFINGSQVRLRDISEMLGQSGLARRTYAVVGQGLVDQALSLRPEERRELFEEAAGVSLYKSKREETLRRLDDTSRNLERVQDLLAEIGPRLRRLERQAERAEQYERLNNELHDLQKTWYGYLWGRAQEALHDARAIAGVQGAQLAERQAELDVLSQQLVRVREQQSTLRGKINTWRRQANTLRIQSEATRRELAVLSERYRLLEAQLVELEASASALQAQRGEQAGQLAETQVRLKSLRQEAAECTQRIAQARASLHERQTRRGELNTRRSEAQKRAFQLGAQMAGLHNRRAQLAERRSEIQSDLTTHQDEKAQLEEELAQQRQVIQNAEADLAALAGQEAGFRAQIADCAAQISASQERQAELDGELRRVRAAETGVHARLEALGKVRTELGGYSAGAQAVMNAGIAGIRGTLVRLITVPEAWERAIEAALGPDVQAVVADTWEAVLAARRCLDEAGGYATLVSLDLLQESAQQHAATGSGSGFWQRLLARLGLGPVGAKKPGFFVSEGASASSEAAKPGFSRMRRASDVVTCEAPLRPVAEALLGSTLLAEDLAAARAIAPVLKPGEQVVTREGDVLRANGTVLLGREEGSSGLLAREREWLELPAQLAVAQKQTAEIQARYDREAAHQLELGNRQSALTRAAGEISEQARNRSSERNTLARAAERLEGQIKWEAERVGQLQGELETLQVKNRKLETEIQTLTARQATTEAEVAACEAQLAALPLEELRTRLSELQTAAAVAEQAVQGQQAVLSSQQSALAQLDAQLNTRTGRAAQLRRERFNLEAQLENLQVKDSQASSELTELEARIQPAEARQAELELLRNSAESKENAARARIRDFEARHNTALLEVSRREAETAALRARIEEDLGLVELEMGEDLTGPVPLPLRPIIEELPTVEELPKGLEKSIQRRKAAMRRLGPINAEAQTEYRETLERHTFLTTQCADLEQAIASLHQVIAELDELIRVSFLETFEAIAVEFKKTFSQLFGGGSAKIVLTEPDSVATTGIDIVARPPGKRQQGLALLSGGERSLTAAALLFAILKVRPTPFCVLDEVDAALDEANIVRFRDMLKELSSSTQFVLITHNRGTIEVADTIYGITMGSDHASQVLSYRLDGQEIAPISRS